MSRFAPYRDVRSPGSSIYTGRRSQMRSMHLRPVLVARRRRLIDPPRRLRNPAPMILVDPILTHGDTNLGNDTQPPGVTGLDWCHLVSTVDRAELDAFLDANPGIGQPSSNVRIKSGDGGIDGGSLITYAGLDATMRDAAVEAGALQGNKRYVVSHAFDSAGQSVYEPGWT